MLYHARTFGFYRSLPRNVVARVLDMRLIDPLSRTVSLADPQIGFWSYSLRILTQEGAKLYARNAAPVWSGIDLDPDTAFEVLIHDEDSGSDIGLVTFQPSTENVSEPFSRGDFCEPDRGSFCIRLMFPNPAKEADLLGALNGSKYLTPYSLDVASQEGRALALYTDSAEGDSTRENTYKRELLEKPKAGDRFVRAEVFCKDTDGSLRWRAVCDALPDFHDLETGGRLYYNYTPGSRKSLIVYFDYSRRLEKNFVYQEYLPRFGMKTDSSVLVLSNYFGYWGTAICFDSGGQLIVADVLDFLNQKMAEAGAERAYLIGGSQGATAALIYGGLMPGVEQIHAAVPVPFSTKSMLLHLKEAVRPQDVHLARDMLVAALRGRPVHLYSTQGDPLCDWHTELARTSNLCEFIVCDDVSVRHADCLQHFIKDIYSTISQRESTFV